MTTREKATYDLIVSNSEKGYITTQKEICDNYPYDPEERKDGYVWNDNPKVHDHCSTVWKDINNINAEQGNKPIIFSDYVYTVPHNYEELKAFAKDYYWRKAMSALWRYGNLLRKGKSDGTIDLLEEKAFEAFVENVFEQAMSQQ